MLVLSSLMPYLLLSSASDLIVSFFLKSLNSTDKRLVCCRIYAGISVNQSKHEACHRISYCTNHKSLMVYLPIGDEQNLMRVLLLVYPPITVRQNLMVWYISNHDVIDDSFHQSAYARIVGVNYTTILYIYG